MHSDGRIVHGELGEVQGPLSIRPVSRALNHPTGASLRLDLPSTVKYALRLSCTASWTHELFEYRVPPGKVCNLREFSLFG